MRHTKQIDVDAFLASFYTLDAAFDDDALDRIAAPSFAAQVPYDPTDAALCRKGREERARRRALKLELGRAR